MPRQTADQTVRRTLTVPVPPARAFAVFADGMATWWPKENAFGKDAFETVVVQPRPGGRWFERDVGGRELDWGRVLTYDPPHRLALTWQITPCGQPEPDPAKASTVEVRFVAEGPAITRVELEHRAFARHGGEGGARWRAAMESAEGWSKFLGRYTAAVADA